MWTLGKSQPLWVSTPPLFCENSPHTGVKILEVGDLGQARHLTITCVACLFFDCFCGGMVMPYYMACGILVPWPGIESGLWQ